MKKLFSSRNLSSEDPQGSSGPSGQAEVLRRKQSGSSGRPQSMSSSQQQQQQQHAQSGHNRAHLIRDNSVNAKRPGPMIAGEPLHDYQRAVDLLKSNKFLAEGFLMKRVEVAPDGKAHPHNPESQWAKWFVQLSGCIMSVWNAADMEQAAKENRTVPPQYLNLADAFVHPFPPNPRAAPTPTPFQFALNTAGLNRILFCAPNLQSLTMWINAIRLACWERSRCNEIYTGVLLYQRAPATGWTGLAMNDIEGWIRCRLPGDTEWRRVYMTIIRGKSSGASQTSATAKKSKRSSFLGFGGGNKKETATDVIVDDLPGGGQLSTIAFWSDKPQKKDVPLCIAQHLYYVSAVYPEVDALVETSSMFKIEGTFLNPADGYKFGWGVGGRAEKQGYALVMLEKGGQFEMLEWIVGLSDAFKLYGRPKGYSFDPRDPNSLYFALPLGVHRDRMFLDRELIDHLDINESRPRAIRAIFHNILFDRMQGRRPLNLPPIDTNRTAADSPSDYTPQTGKKSPYGSAVDHDRTPMERQSSYNRQSPWSTPVLPPIGEGEAQRNSPERSDVNPAYADAPSQRETAEENHSLRQQPQGQREVPEETRSTYTTASESRFNTSSPGHIEPSRATQDFRHSTSSFAQPLAVHGSNDRSKPLPSPGGVSNVSSGAAGTSVAPVRNVDSPDAHSRPSSRANPALANSTVLGSSTPPSSSRGVSPVPPPSSSQQYLQQRATGGLALRNPDDDRLGYLAGQNNPAQSVPLTQTASRDRTASPLASDSERDRTGRNLAVAGAGAAAGSAAIAAAALRPNTPSDAHHEDSQSMSTSGVPAKHDAARTMERERPVVTTTDLKTSGRNDATVTPVKPSPKDLNNTSFLNDGDSNIHSDLMAALNFVDRSDSPPQSSVGFPSSSADHSPVQPRVLQQQSLRDSFGPPPKSFAPSSQPAVALSGLPAPSHQRTDSQATEVIAPSAAPVASSVTARTVPTQSSTTQSPALNERQAPTFAPSQPAEERAKAAVAAAQARKDALSKPGRAGIVPGARTASGWADEADEDDDNYVGSSATPITATTAPIASNGATTASAQSTPVTSHVSPPLPASSAAAATGPSIVSSTAPTPVVRAQETPLPAAPAQSKYDPHVNPAGLVQAGIKHKEAKSAKAIEERSRQTGEPLVKLDQRAPSPTSGLIGSIPAPRSNQQVSPSSAPMQARSSSNGDGRPMSLSQSQPPSSMSQFGGTYGGYNPMMMGSMGYGGMPPWMMGGFGGPMMSPGMFGGGPASPGGTSSDGNSRNSTSFDPMAMHMQQQQAMMAAQQAYMAAMAQFQSPPTSPTGSISQAHSQLPQSSPSMSPMGFPAYTGFNVPMYGGYPGMFGQMPPPQMHGQQQQQQQQQQGQVDERTTSN